MKVLIVFLILNTPISGFCQHWNKIARADIQNVTFDSGLVTPKKSHPYTAFLYFHRPGQRLYVVQDADTLSYTASEINSFRIWHDDEATDYISWKLRRDWPSYEKMTFLRVIGDFGQCAVVTSDRKPHVTDANPADRYEFVARTTQGIEYHLFLPDGKVVPYKRQTIDEHLKNILKDNYEEVMQYSVENGLMPTRLNDLLSILTYAAQLR